MFESFRNSMYRLLEPLLLAVQKTMASDVMPRYMQLELREKYLVLGAAVLLPIMILIFLLILPLQDRQIALQKQAASLHLQAEKAATLAQQLQSGGTQSKAQPVNLLSSVERIAREGAVRQYITRIRPQNRPGDKQQLLMVQLKNAPYQDIVRLMDALGRAKLEIKSMKINATASAGLVHVQTVIGSL
ncbi:MAG: type II secretion system protein GspM [Mariprofundus sp.]|nr:type II secretion system protein GspM [Mariprofundus sp.]